MHALELIPLSKQCESAAIATCMGSEWGTRRIQNLGFLSRRKSRPTSLIDRCSVVHQVNDATALFGRRMCHYSMLRKVRVWRVLMKFARVLSLRERCFFLFLCNWE